MFERRSLKWPITLGVVMILLVIVLTIGWVLLNVLGAMADAESAAVYWTMLAIGSVVLLLILVGVIFYLTLTVKAINLNRRQSNFIDSVTHELKSPIASLKLYLQTLSRRNVEADQQADFHRYMLEDVERLDQLINHLLDAARLDRVVDPEPAEACQLQSILHECAAAVALRYRLPAERIHIDVPPIVLQARPVALNIIFRNLIDNAAKYGGTPPEVQVTARRSANGRVTVQISDNGSGIPHKLRRKVFGRFVRVGSELERNKPGTGLGLYLVRTLVKSLGGAVRIRDRWGVPGTEFEVVLPGVVPQGQPAEAPGAGAPGR